MTELFDTLMSLCFASATLRADDSWPFAKEESSVLVSACAQLRSEASPSRNAPAKAKLHTTAPYLNDRTVCKAPSQTKAFGWKLLLVRPSIDDFCLARPVKIIERRRSEVNSSVIQRGA